MRLPLLSETSGDQRAQAQVYAQGLQQPLPGAQPVAMVGVLGGASAGLGVALALARTGSTVIYLEEDASSLERAQFFLSRMLQGDTAPAGLRFSCDLGQVAECDVLLDMEADTPAQKQGRLAAAEALIGPQVPLITNLSGPHLSALATRMQGPERLLAAQFVFPMGRQNVAELAQHAGTGDTALGMATRLLRQMGRQPVNCGVWGFLSERLQMRMLEAADTLLMDGATPWDIDEALEAFGYSMGLYEAQDLIGTDVAYAIRTRTERQPGRRYIPIADRAVQEGRLGKKASVGWYRYPGGEGKVIDPLVEDLCREEAHFAGVRPREFSPDQLRQRVILALMNEAAWALGDGCTAEDIDLLSVQALGFPQEFGGPLYFARQLGVQGVAQTLQQLAQEDPVAWRLAPLFAQALA